MLRIEVTCVAMGALAQSGSVDKASRANSLSLVFSFPFGFETVVRST
jgi:hypothetical protein